MSGVVLYDFWRSSASYRVRIALNLAGITYRGVSVDLTAGEQRSDNHLARNPQGLVPVLEIDGLRLTQSLAIIDYLDQTRGLGLLPPEPAARAHTLALAQSIAVDLHPVCNLSVAQYATSLSDDADGMRGTGCAISFAPAYWLLRRFSRVSNKRPIAPGPSPDWPMFAWSHKCTMRAVGT